MDFPCSAYLRGREVRIQLTDGEHWVALTNLHVARIEEEFGGRKAFDAMFEDRPHSAVRRYIAIALGHEVPLGMPVLEDISKRMIQEEWTAYLAFVEATWLLAHGAAEDDAKKVWEGKIVLENNGVRVTVDVTEEAVKILTTSPGKNGSKRGRRSSVPISKPSGG